LWKKASEAVSLHSTCRRKTRSPPGRLTSSAAPAGTEKRSERPPDQPCADHPRRSIAAKF
jgi:hypothetical protein